MSRQVFIIVDLSEVIREVSKRKGLYDFFSRFSLCEVIETILSVCPYIDYSDRDNGPVSIWIESLAGLRFENEDITFDCDLINIFYDALASDLDEAISNSFKGTDLDIVIDRKHRIDVHKASYVFERWVDNTSIMLKFEE